MNRGEQMFIHLGGNRMISINEVIAIVDATVKKTSFTSSSFFINAKHHGWVETIASDEIKSYVITDYKIYASPISSLTLKKRAHHSQMTAQHNGAKLFRK